MICVCVCVYMYICNDKNGYCIAVCTELKEQAKNEPNFISNFITGDESWVFGYYSETKQQLSQWKDPQLHGDQRKHDKFGAFFVGRGGGCS